MDDADQFFDGVAGKKSVDSTPNPLHDFGLKVRAVALQRLEERNGSTLTPEQLRDRDALMNYLSKRSLFGESAALKRLSILSALLNRLPGSGWGRPVAFVSMLAFGAVLVFQLRPGPNDLTATRGEIEPTILSSRPAETQRDLTAALQAAGARVEVVQINDTMWTLAIELPAANTASGAQLEYIETSLAKFGVKMPHQPQFSVVVKLTGK